MNVLRQLSECWKPAWNTFLRATALAAVFAAIALILAGCGSSEGPQPEPDLFKKYLSATDVKNDRVPGGRTSEDRMANLAAHYSVEQLHTRLLTAFPCSAGRRETPRRSPGFDTSCDLNQDVRNAVDRAGGGQVFGRVILVERENGSLELLTLYVANDVLIDTTGKTYDSLNDFRRRNDLLTSDDVILTLREITAVPGGGEIVTVYGHTNPAWPARLIGAAVVVLLLGAARLVWRDMARRRRHGSGPS